MKNALSFVPTINLRRLRIPFLSLTLFAHCYPLQTLLWLKIYQKLFSTHMHNWLLLYIHPVCRKNTYQSAVIRSISQCYQSAVIRSISQCLAPKFASLSQPQKPEVIQGFLVDLQSYEVPEEIQLGCPLDDLGQSCEYAN